MLLFIHVFVLAFVLVFVSFNSQVPHVCLPKKKCPSVCALFYIFTMAACRGQVWLSQISYFILPHCFESVKQIYIYSTIKAHHYFQKQPHFNIINVINIGYCCGNQPLACRFGCNSTKLYLLIAISSAENSINCIIRVSNLNITYGKKLNINVILMMYFRLLDVKCYS